MLRSFARPLYSVKFPEFSGERKMLPFNLETLSEVPEIAKETVKAIIKGLDIKQGIAHLSIEAKPVLKLHCASKVGKHIINDFHNSGGMLIVSDIPLYKGWNGIFNGIVSDSRDLTTYSIKRRGFKLESNMVYYTTPDFILESLPAKKNINRIQIKIILPEFYNYLIS